MHINLNFLSKYETMHEKNFGKGNCLFRLLWLRACPPICNIFLGSWTGPKKKMNSIQLPWLEKSFTNFIRLVVGKPQNANGFFLITDIHSEFAEKLFSSMSDKTLHIFFQAANTFALRLTWQQLCHTHVLLVSTLWQFSTKSFHLTNYWKLLSFLLTLKLLRKNSLVELACVMVVQVFLRKMLGTRYGPVGTRLTRFFLSLGTRW